MKFPTPCDVLSPSWTTPGSRTKMAYTSMRRGTPGQPSLPMDGFRRRFGVPEARTPIGAIAIGYPDPGSDPVGTPPPSLCKSLDDLVHEGRW
jgi:hypothetical protein